MKLVEKTTLYYLIYTLFIFAIGTLLFYFLIRNVIFDGINEALHQEKVQIIDNLKYEAHFEYHQPGENIEIRKVNLKRELPDHYSTITLTDSAGVKSRFRQLKSVYGHGGKYYEITIRQSLAEAETLIKSLLPVEVVLFLILLAGVLIISRQVSRNLWQPCYDILENHRNYNLTKTGIIPALPSGIDEFEDLSESIEKMTQKIYSDYINQKEFNENSSHELQTPLAIIRNKLELLIQSRNMDEKDLELIQSIFDAVKRLTMLNKGLILLSKIDNEQFHDTEEVRMEVLLGKILSNFKEIIEEKELDYSLEVSDEGMVEANPILMEILLSNLISNALKHNFQKGMLSIHLGEGYLQIANSGNALTSEARLMFERFRKESLSENSVGLGLAIVKKICDLSHFDVTYDYADKVHTIHLKF
jgi:signal transduction histidine kinase